MLINYEKMLSEMSLQQIDALIASNCENVYYAASFQTNSTYRYKYGRVRAHCVHLRSDILNPVLIVPVDLLAHLAVSPSWVKDIRSYGNYYVFGQDNALLSDAAAQFLYYMRNCPHYATADDALADVLREKGLQRARIAIDETNLPPGAWDHIVDVAPKASIVRGNGIFKKIRMIKSIGEIELIKESTRVNDEAVRKVIEAVKEGASEMDLYHCYRHHLVERDSHLGFYTTGCGNRSGAVYSVPPSNVILKKGDSIRLDVGCTYRGYWSDTARTIFLGKPSNVKYQHFDAIRKGVFAGEKMLRPGLRVSELFSEMVNTVRESGIPEYNRHHVGHSMGLETYEAPLIIPSDEPGASDRYIAGDWEMTIEENMILNLECPFYHLSIGGVQFEETYLITKTGYVRLSALDREAYVVDN